MRDAGNLAFVFPILMKITGGTTLKLGCTVNPSVNISCMNRLIHLTILLLMIQQNAFAACETDRFGVVYCGRGDCAQDKQGKIYCSRYLFGNALLDKHGNVVCGKGKCLPSTKFDDFYCSAVESGGAKLDRFGVVKCYGGCEQATALMCESVKGQ